MSEPHALDWVDCKLQDCFRIDSGSTPGGFRIGTANVPLMGANGAIGTCSTSNFGPGYIVGRVGAAGAVTRVQGRVWASDNALTLEPKEMVDSDFAHYLLLAAKPWELATVTAQPLVTKSTLGALRVLRPSYVEQQSIARILGTLDASIQETEAIIAKLKAVKQGLLHDLLTRGIDANGELRSPQAEAPHLYKQSPLGWIPKAWEAHVFGRTVEHLIDFRGRTAKKLGMDWGGGDILALSANNVQPGAIDISREAYFGGERLYHKWMTNGDLWKGDVLLTMEAPLGNVAQIPDDARYILSQRVIALRFNTGVVLNDFAFWQMQSNEFQQAMVRRSTGSTATGIQRAELVKLHFKAPPLQEQSLIAERLASLEHKLESERLALAKQVQQKAGLVDDLLTGRVRVTPLLEGAA